MDISRSHVPVSIVLQYFLVTVHMHGTMALFVHGLTDGMEWKGKENTKANSFFRVVNKKNKKEKKIW